MSTTLTAPADLRLAIDTLPPRERTTTIAHVGISVPDIDLAIAWYTTVLGFEHLAGPVEADVEAEGWGELIPLIHDERIRRLKLAQLTGANGSGVELLEYVDPPFAPAERWTYERAGTTHLNVVDPDVEGLLARIVAAGGRRRAGSFPLAPDTPYRFAFAEDPWGTVIEVYSHTPERVYGGAPAPA